MTTISFRVDPELESALQSMTDESHPRSQVIREAIMAAYRSWREAKMAAEYDAIAAWRETDSEEAEIRANRSSRRAVHAARMNE